MTLVRGRSVNKPFFHPRTHDIPVANIHFRSHHVPLLNLFTHFATHAASSLGMPVSQVVNLPTQRRLWTVIRSPFVHKKSQENFERKTYKRVIKAFDADHEVINRWTMYLEKNIMAGVGMRMVKWERAPVGVGKRVLGVIEHAAAGDVRKPTDQEKIKALGDKIIKQELPSAAAAPHEVPVPGVVKAAKSPEASH